MNRNLIFAPLFLMACGTPADLADPVDQEDAIRGRDIRTEHSLHWYLSERWMQELVQHERVATQLQSSLDKALIASRGRATRGLMTEAKQLGAVEREIDALFGAVRAKAQSQLLNAERQRTPVDTKLALKVACHDLTTTLRRTVRSLATDIGNLSDDRSCAGDIVGDRLIYRACLAATAEDRPAYRRALGAVGAQLMCLSTQQLERFENTFVPMVDTVAARLFKNAVVQTQFRSAVAPIVFLLGDMTRHFSGHEKRALLWFKTHRAALKAQAADPRSMLARNGFVVINRFTGSARAITDQCIATRASLFAGGDRRPSRVYFSEGRCNPLPAMIDAMIEPVEALRRSQTFDLSRSRFNCDAMHWVPASNSRLAASGLACDPDCAGLPTAPAVQTVLRYALNMPGCEQGGLGSGSDGGGQLASGGFGLGANQQGCEFSMLAGVPEQMNPAVAYNQAMTECLFALGEQGALPLDSGYAPTGADECMFQDGGGTDPEPPETSPDEAAQQNDTFEGIKEAVKAAITVVAGVINAMAGEEIITQEGIEAAQAAVDEATLDEQGITDNEGNEVDVSVTECTGDACTIEVDPDQCSNANICGVNLLHEAMHVAIFASGGDYDADWDHAFLGETAEESSWFFRHALGTGGDCAADQPSCGCTQMDEVAQSCTNVALDAYTSALQDLQMDADSCATDACWNPMNEYSDAGAGCGGAQNECQGQTVALCPEDNPDCMCRDSALNEADLLRMRSAIWQDYCERAYDENCDSPLPPVGFGDGNPPPEAGGYRVSPVLVHSDGSLELHQEMGNDCAMASSAFCQGAEGAW